MKIKYLLFALSVTSLTSCFREEKKISSQISISPSNIENQAPYYANEAAVRSETDKIIDDVNTVLSKTSVATGRTDGLDLPCGVFKVDSISSDLSLNRPQIFRIRYDSSKNCAKVVRKGLITVSIFPIGAKWKDQGAKLELNFSGYQVYYPLSSQTLTFSGVKTLTNQSGGQIINLVIAPIKSSIVHIIRGNLNVTYNSGKSRKWYVSRKKTYSTTNGNWSGLELKVEGDSLQNIAESGINRDGETFITYFNTPIIYTNCGNDFIGPYKITSGVIKYSVNENYLLATGGFSLNSVNKAIAVNDCSAMGYYLQYFLNGKEVANRFQEY